MYFSKWLVIQSLSNFFSDSDIPCIGASGAISGVMGTYLIWFPNAELSVLIGFLDYPVPAAVFVVVWFVYQLVFAGNSLSVAPSGVAWLAHIGGFIAGIVVGIRLKRQVRKEGEAQ